MLLFSGGKDSIVLLRLAEKAFRPAGFPFPVMHIDTGHNFPEVVEFRDRRVAELGERLVVARVQDSIDAGRVVDQPGRAHRAISCRRRRCSTRSSSTVSTPPWAAPAATRSAPREGAHLQLPRRVRPVEPPPQRPELWNLYNGRIRKGEQIRVFPISNWTELDVWQYIAREQLELPSIYFAHERDVFRRDGMLYAVSAYVELLPGEAPFSRTCASGRSAT